MFKKMLPSRLLRSALFVLCLGSGAAQASLTLSVSPAPSASMATFKFKSSAAYTAHLVVLKGASPTNCSSDANKIRAGQDNADNPAYRRGSLVLAAGTAATYTVRNLEHSSSYTVCTFNVTGVVQTETFTTPAMTTYANPSWQAVGGAAYSYDSDNQSLAFAPDGSPYVAYQTGSKASVRRYNGTAWQQVGSAGFSTGGVGFQSLSIAPDGTPYLAYRDGGNSNKATVMRYNAAATTPAWELVGSAGFSAGIAYSQSLSFAPDGTPYVAYTDYSVGLKSTVTPYVRLLVAP